MAILIPAEKRAYSWYQHMRAHGDPTAINMSFKQVPLFMIEIVNIIQDFFFVHNVNARCLSVIIFVSSSAAAVSLNPVCIQSFCSQIRFRIWVFDDQKV